MADVNVDDMQPGNFIQAGDRFYKIIKRIPVTLLSKRPPDRTYQTTIYITDKESIKHIEEWNATYLKANGTLPDNPVPELGELRYGDDWDGWKVITLDFEVEPGDTILEVIQQND